MHCFKLGISNPATVRQVADLLTGLYSYQGIGRRLSTITIRWLLARLRMTGDGGQIIPFVIRNTEEE